MKKNLEIHLADTCNLNCSFCSHFSPIAEEEYLNPMQFERNLSLIDNNILNKFDTIRLLGGEPLLNKNIKEIIKIIRKYFKNRIQIVTNGILLSKQDDEFYKICIDNEICISITKYPIKLNYNRIIYNLKDKFPNLLISTYRSGLTFYPVKIDVNGTQDKDERYKKCSIIKFGCMQLVETKLYICSLSAYMKYFNKKYNYNIKDNEYLDLSNITNFNEIESWYNKSKDICKYCMRERNNPIPWTPYNINSSNYIYD